MKTYEQKKRESQWVCEGFCFDCGINRAMPNGRCISCFQAKHNGRNPRSQSAQKIAKNRVALGLCMRCAEPRTHSHHCDKCYADHVASKFASSRRSQGRDTAAPKWSRRNSELIALFGEIKTPCQWSRSFGKDSGYLHHVSRSRGISTQTALLILAMTENLRKCLS